MPLSTTRWNSAAYFESDEDIRRYVEACLEETGDDSACILHALGVIARTRNMSQLARETGLSRKGLDEALSGEGNPSFATVAEVAGALGLQVIFRPGESDERSVIRHSSSQVEHLSVGTSGSTSLT